MLLVADGLNQWIRQARFEDFAILPGQVSTGRSPNHFWVEDPYVFLVNSLGNTVQVLRRNAARADADSELPRSLDGGVVHRPLDGGLFPAGLQLETVGELNLGPQSSPQAIVKVANHLFIPLYSGQVARVDVSDPLHPSLAQSFDLTQLDLRSFDGGVSFPRPASIAAFKGKVYVALSNLDSSYSPAGPGMLAKIDPATGAISAVDLGADACLSAFWAASDDDSLYVSCSGRVVYRPAYQILSVEKSGVVLLGADEQRRSSWTVSCAPDADGGCIPPSVGRFALFGQRLYLGDQAGGRVFVVDAVNQQLIERRGHNAPDGGPPILACPNASGISLVIDVIAIP